VAAVGREQPGDGALQCCRGLNDLEGFDGANESAALVNDTVDKLRRPIPCTPSAQLALDQRAKAEARNLREPPPP
jgi:hypothetical protein